jgi:hypothetical protein
MALDVLGVRAPRVAVPGTPVGQPRLHRQRRLIPQEIVHRPKSAGPNLDYGGCHWHPSRNDHQLIADRLSDYLATLPLRW